MKSAQQPSFTQMSPLENPQVEFWRQRLLLCSRSNCTPATFPNALQEMLSPPLLPQLITRVLGMGSGLGLDGVPLP